MSALPFGRSLEDLWLDAKKDKLHPAERVLLDCAARGQMCELGKERPEAPKDDKLIRAELLRFIALGGGGENPLHERGVGLKGAYISCASGQLDFNGSLLPENLALHDCLIDGEVVLHDTRAETISLAGCKVGGLIGDRLETRGSLFLRDGFVSEETIRLLGAKIGGDFDCRNGRFLCPDTSLAINRMTVDAAVFLNESFVAMGKVSMEDCKIGAGLNCRAGSFNANDQSLSLKFSTIDGNVDFGVHKDKDSEDRRAHCSFAGGVSLQSTKIEGDLIFTETRFNGTGNINLRNARIAGQLYWRQMSRAENEDVEGDAGSNSPASTPGNTISELNLAGATCLTLNMDWESWTVPERVRLDHFTYEGFSELPSDWNAKRWKAWLERQPDHHLTSRFRPHPYQQLAKVLDGSGYEEEARVIRIERREKQRLFARFHEPRPDDLWGRSLRGLANFWRWVQKIFIGHGYRPGVAVIWLLGLVAAGWGVYGYAGRAGIMTPTHPLIFKEAIWQGDPASTPAGRIPQACRENWVYPAHGISGVCAASVASEYSTFNALVYSLDTAIPVVNFRMEDDWAPRVVNWKTGLHDWPGWWVRIWEWVQIGLGWAFSLLFVSAIGGVIRRD